MKKDILFTLPSYFRDDMNIMAYRFGKGEKTCAVVGALRGDEVQQLYVCARLVSFLREVEKEDGVQPGKSVMIVPTVIGASMNEGSRLWEPENMDINRRFPGDVTGSTTEPHRGRAARPPQKLSLRRAAHQLLSARLVRAAWCA